MTGRREFIRKSILTVGFGSIAGKELLSAESPLRKKQAVNGRDIKISGKKRSTYNPLDYISISTSGREGILFVEDGSGIEYFRINNRENLRFRVAGHLGVHRIILTDEENKIMDFASFPVNCQSGIEDESGEFNDLFKTLYYTLTSSSYNAGQTRRMNGKLYTYFSSWFQDHMYAMLGMRYFNRELKTGVDLYTDGQREDGMIHDNYKHRWEKNGSWSRRFDYGDFVTIPEDPSSSAIFVRVPVENIAEFTYMESVYRTWKITGDDVWMNSKLDSMLKAMNYSLSDPYRWSEKFSLLKRGYTIDIWDFQSNYDSRIAGDDTMRVYLDKSHFGISYADNIRFAQSCNFLSEMLKYAGREGEAGEVRKVSEEIFDRINELSWNGKFYRHWVPEEPRIDRGFGEIDESSQVSLSNTWILNRGMIPHNKIVSIIKTYQRIKGEMPASSPGEWYCCYPPFPKGWSAKKWNYMNGGVSPIAAGELSLAAFEHGFESYGVDILRRVKKLADKKNKVLHGCYKGAIIEEPERIFTKLNLREVANTDTRGDGERPKGVMGWTGEGDNDLHAFPKKPRNFKDIPFDIIDPSKNERRAVLGLSAQEGYSQKAEFEIKDKAGSLYFLHCISNGSLAGSITWHYSDKSTYVRYISAANGQGMPRSISNWWQPDIRESNKHMQFLHTAWTGKNNHSPKVGVVIYGMNNPQPEKKIDKIVLEASKDKTLWLILGLTLSDEEVYFEPGILSTIPKHWAAAECMYGLMEGLAGIKNTGIAFDRATLAPRWDFAGEKAVKATAKYEASSGYVSYIYRKQNSSIFIDFTGTAEETDLQIILPPGKNPEKLQVNGRETNFSIKRIEKSSYAVFRIRGTGVHEVEMKMT